MLGFFNGVRAAACKSLRPYVTHMIPVLSCMRKSAMSLGIRLPTNYIMVLDHNVVLSRCHNILPCRGKEPVLRKRIKQHMRKQLIQSDPSPPWDLVNQVEGNPYGLDYPCILDFEATCEEVNSP